MGVWGTGAFENDDALDFAAELTESEGGWALVREVLSEVAEAEDDVEAPEACRALAAAECVAIARGKPSPIADREAVQWCKDHPLKDPSKLAALAVKAVRRIRTSSELKDLWEEGSDAGWDAGVAELEKRLL